MLLPTGDETNDNDQDDPGVALLPEGTYPKNEMTARAIQHTIPIYGTAAIPLSSPEINTVAVQSSLAGRGGAGQDYEATAYRCRYEPHIQHRKHHQQ